MGRWFNLYLILDPYSLKIVGWEVYDADHADHAAHLVRRTALAEGIAAMGTKPVLRTATTAQANSWDCARRIVVVRQSIKRKNAPGKTLSLFADDPDIQGWRYGAMVTSLSLPTVEIWRSYRGRADCENRIKELKNDFGLDSFNLNSFYATEAALGFAMLAYNLMSVFRQAVMRAKIQPTLTTLHQQVLAVGAYWNRAPNQNQLLLAVSRRRRAWFEGLWANAGHPPVLPIQAKIG
jgi:hypothetical protein